MDSKELIKEERERRRDLIRAEKSLNLTRYNLVIAWMDEVGIIGDSFYKEIRYDKNDVQDWGGFYFGWQIIDNFLNLWQYYLPQNIIIITEHMGLYRQVQQIEEDFLRENKYRWTEITREEFMIQKKYDEKQMERLYAKYSKSK